jgi:hypothetical protein
MKIPKKFEILVGKPKKQIRSRLTTACQGGQNNRNGKTNAVLFWQCYLLVYKYNMEKTQ